MLGRLRSLLLLTLESMMLFACLTMLAGASRIHAQSTGDRVLTLEVQLKQDEKVIGETNGHLANTDANVTRIWQEVNSIQNTLSLIQGEEIGFTAFLTLLCGSTLVIQVRGKKRNGD